MKTLDDIIESFSPLAFDPVEMEKAREKRFGLTDEQREFVKAHELGLSDAYIGMLRVYCGNRTVFSTSAAKVIMGCAAQGQGGPKVDWAALEQNNRKQFQTWIRNLMTLSEPEIAERLSVHIPFA
jgi:hypothetical protein